MFYKFFAIFKYKLRVYRMIHTHVQICLRELGVSPFTWTNTGQLLNTCISTAYIPIALLYNANPGRIPRNASATFQTNGRNVFWTAWFTYSVFTFCLIHCTKKQKATVKSVVTFNVFWNKIFSTIRHNLINKFD